MTDSNSSGKKILVLVISIVMGLSAVSLLVGASGAGSSPAVSKEMIPSALPAGDYYVNFTESGLPTGTLWSIYIGTNSHNLNNYNSTTGKTNSYIVTNDTYYFGNIHQYSAYSFTWNPSSGSIYVNGNNVFVNVVFTNITAPQVQSYYHYFNITNLPYVMSGITWTWTVTLTELYTNTAPVTYSSNTASIYISSLYTGTYSYSVSTPSGTELAPSSGTLSITSNATTSLSFSFAKNYEVKFVESGLHSGQTFEITLTNNSNSNAYYTNTSITGYGYTDVYVPDGTYTYQISNYPTSYTATPSHGTVTVNGSSISLNITFTTQQSTYSASFKVVNLPTNIPDGYWYFQVTLAGKGNTYTVSSHSTTAEFTGLQNGSYYYTVTNGGTGTPSIGSTLSPASGTIKINGTSQVINLTLLPPVQTYYANFTITSFSSVAGYTLSWYIEVSNNTGAVTFGPLNSYDFSVSGLLAGTYNYYLYAESPFAFKSSQGTFAIKDSNVTISLSLITTKFYTVTFTATGLMQGSIWSVVLDTGFVYNNTFTGTIGVPNGSTSTVPIVFSLPDGTYYFQAYVTANGKYYFQQPVKVVVNGKQVTHTFSFAPGTSSGAATLTTALIYTGIAAAGVIVGGLVAYVLIRRRKLPPKTS